MTDDESRATIGRPSWGVRYIVPFRPSSPILFGVPLQESFQRHQELVGCRPVDQAVVEGQRQIAHWPDGDRVYPLTRDHDRALLNRADAQDRRLRLVDDRHREQAAADTMIGDCEGATL